MNIQTQKIAVISTSHIDAYEMHILLQLLNNDEVPGMLFDGGWIISTAPLNHVAEIAVPGLKHIVEFFSDKGFDWVMFNKNGSELDELPVYDW